MSNNNDKQPKHWTTKIVHDDLPTFRVKREHGFCMVAHVCERGGAWALCRLQNQATIRIPWDKIADSINTGAPVKVAYDE